MPPKQAPASCRWSCWWRGPWRVGLRACIPPRGGGGGRAASHVAHARLKSPVSVHVPDALVPSASPLRLRSEVAPETALAIHHSFQTQFASPVVKSDRKVCFWVPVTGYVAFMPLRSLFVAAWRSVWVAAKAVAESPTPR